MRFIYPGQIFKVNPKGMEPPSKALHVVVTDYQGQSYLLDEIPDDPPKAWFYRGAPNLLYRNRFAEVLVTEGREKWSSTQATTFAIKPWPFKANS